MNETADLDGEPCGCRFTKDGKQRYQCAFHADQCGPLVERTSDTNRSEFERGVAIGQAIESAEGCICRGNWRAIVKEIDSLIGTRFKDEHTGRTYTLFGLVYTDEDYYFGMSDEETGEMRLLSCVGALDRGHGYTAIDGPRPEGQNSLEYTIERNRKRNCK